MILRYCWLLAAVAFLMGCGREERSEAVRFCKVLKQKQSDFASVNAVENEFLTGARGWCGAIVAGGAGRGDQLKQNAAAARDLAKSAAAISTQLGRVRQAIYDETLTKEFLQSTRSTMIEQLVKRQRFLQDVRKLLDDSAPIFEEFGKTKAYKGDSYPGEISSLNLTLQAYKGPDDVLGQAVTALTAKYKLTDSETAP